MQDLDVGLLGTLPARPCGRTGEPEPPPIPKRRPCRHRASRPSTIAPAAATPARRGTGGRACPILPTASSRVERAAPLAERGPQRRPPAPGRCPTGWRTSATRRRSRSVGCSPCRSSRSPPRCCASGASSSASPACARSSTTRCHGCSTSAACATSTTSCRRSSSTRSPSQPVAFAGPTRPIADPGRPIEGLGGLTGPKLDRFVADGFGIDLDTLSRVSDAVGVVAALAETEVPVSQRDDIDDVDVRRAPRRPLQRGAPPRRDGDARPAPPLGRAGRRRRAAPTEASAATAGCARRPAGPARGGSGGGRAMKFTQDLAVEYAEHGVDLDHRRPTSRPTRTTATTSCPATCAASWHRCACSTACRSATSCPTPTCCRPSRSASSTSTATGPTRWCRGRSASARSPPPTGRSWRRCTRSCATRSTRPSARSACPTARPASAPRAARSPGSCSARGRCRAGRRCTCVPTPATCWRTTPSPPRPSRIRSG